MVQEASFVEHIELDLCVQFQVSRICCVSGMAFQNYVLDSTTIWLIGFMFLGKHLHIFSSY